MDLFPRAFLLVFCQLAVGGLFCLAIPPFSELERGYYKSSAFVYVAIALLALVGRVALWWDAQRAGDLWTVTEILLWALFVGCASGYLASLWSERPELRAGLFTASWSSGALALAVLAEGYRRDDILSFATLLFPLSFLLSALVLGAAASGMLLGHWYLIDRDLSLLPLQRTTTIYMRALGTQGLVAAATVLLLGVTGSTAMRAGVHDLWAMHTSLLATRAVISPIGAGILGWMIRRTLAVPQTMAATGLYYIAVLAVLVGELLGRFLLFRTGLPL